MVQRLSSLYASNIPTTSITTTTTTFTATTTTTFTATTTTTSIKSARLSSLYATNIPLVVGVQATKGSRGGGHWFRIKNNIIGIVWPGTLEIMTLPKLAVLRNFDTLVDFSTSHKLPLLLLFNLALCTIMQIFV